MTNHITTCPGPECTTLWDLWPLLVGLAVVLFVVGIVLEKINDHRSETDV